MDGHKHNVRFEAALDAPWEVARIGLVNMWVDERGEDAFKRLVPANVRVFTTRMAADLEAYNVEGKFVPLGGFADLSQSLPPPGRIDLIAFSCTSATIAGGEGELERNFEKVRPGVPVTNPASAAVAGLKAAGISQIALLTPYPLPIHKQLRPFFEERGIDIVADGTFSVEPDPEVPLISEASILAAGEKLLGSGGEALFISCTAMDVVDKLPALCRSLKVPVFSSTQLFAWHSLTMLGLEDEAASILDRTR